jgi:hypothetical protein
LGSVLHPKFVEPFGGLPKFNEPFPDNFIEPLSIDTVILNLSHIDCKALTTVSSV